MKARRFIKGWLKAHPKLYYFYTRLRYGAHTEVRDWVVNTHEFLKREGLNTFVFEEKRVYVRLSSGHEFEYVPEQMGGLLGLEFKRGFESEDIQAVLNLLPRGAVVLDVGANFGVYSVLIASVVEGGSVHAFEPVRQTAELFGRNVQRNLVGNRVKLNNVAVGQERGSLEITTDRYAGNYLLDGNSYDGSVQEVPVIRLDDYVAENDLQRIDLIKCDVEGAELLVMKGAGQVLARMRPIVMLEIAEEWTHRFGYSAADLKAHMRDAGYECKHGAEVAAELKLGVGRAAQTHNYFFFPKAQ